MLTASRQLLLAGAGISLTLVGLGGCGEVIPRAGTDATGRRPPAARHPSTNRANRPRPAADRRASASAAAWSCSDFASGRSPARARMREAAEMRAATRAYERATTMGKSELKRIEAIAPRGEEALSRARALRRQLARGGQIQRALAGMDRQHLRELRSEIDEINRSLSALARDYDWRSCPGG